MSYSGFLSPGTCDVVFRRQVEPDVLVGCHTSHTYVQETDELKPTEPTLHRAQSMFLLCIIGIEAIASQEGDLTDNSLNGFLGHRVKSHHRVVAELHGVHAQPVALD